MCSWPFFLFMWAILFWAGHKASPVIHFCSVTCNEIFTNIVVIFVEDVGSVNQPGTALFFFVLGGWKSAKSFSSDILSWLQQSHSEQNGSCKPKGCEHSTNVMKHVKHVLITTATDDINSITYIVSLATKWLTHGFQGDGDMPKYDYLYRKKACSGSPVRYKYNVSWPMYTIQWSITALQWTYFIHETVQCNWTKELFHLAL